VIGRRPAFPIASLIETDARATRVQDAVIGERQLFADGRWQATQVFDRTKLPKAARISGPAVVQQMDATTVIEPGAVATVDAIGNLRIAVGSAP
jgi:N-methylhydantoinase A